MCHAAKDGLVGMGVGTGQQWLDFCVMCGHPEWAEDASLFTERGALSDAIDEWVGERTVAEVLDVASAFRIPNAPIVDGANAPTFDHFRARGTSAPMPPAPWRHDRRCPSAPANRRAPRVRHARSRRVSPWARCPSVGCGCST